MEVMWRALVLSTWCSGNDRTPPNPTAHDVDDCECQHACDLIRKHQSTRARVTTTAQRHTRAYLHVSFFRTRASHTTRFAALHSQRKGASCEKQAGRQEETAQATRTEAASKRRSASSASWCRLHVMSRTKWRSKRASLTTVSVVRSSDMRSPGKKKCMRPKLSRSLRQICTM